MQPELVSIKEFAALAGVSQQAIYKRLSNPNDDLTLYLYEVDNKKKLDVSAVELFMRTADSTSNSTGCSTGCSTVETKLVDILKKELEQKNEQIMNLQKLLSQEQQLHLLTKQELLALTAPKEEPTEPHKEESKESEAEQKVEPPKKWWQFWR